MGDFEVIGCDSEYFSGLSTATVDTVPCTTNAECVALGAEYGLDCSDPDTIECYCELGYYEGLDWTENVPWECSVTSKYSGVQCPAIPGAE